MVKSDSRITKNEKGPLQRFKNQNTVLKKFGENGVKVYKAITGKRTPEELRKDLGMEESTFNQMIEFMFDNQIIMYEGSGSEEVVETSKEEVKTPKTKKKKIEEKEPEQKEPEIKQTKIKPKEEPKLPEIKEMEITPDNFEIKPEIEFKEEIKEEVEIKKTEEIKPKEEKEDIKPEIEFTPEIDFSAEEKKVEEVKIEEKEEKIEVSEDISLSPVEKIISDKYGEVGLKVYALIDGQRTAEEIMKETGLTQTKLGEVLDFMDEQGIIKLDYPKGGVQQAAPKEIPKTEEKSDGAFSPLIEKESLDESGPVPSPIEIPTKAPTDLVKSLQGKAKLLVKYGERGDKVFNQIDGKNDIVEISLKSGLALYTVYEIQRFLLENGLIAIRPMQRGEVKKKYGDDAYSVYKKYGKEGLMLYELIGKDMNIKQMAQKVTTDKNKVIEIFVFIRSVLGLELPIDKEVLAKQLQ